VNNLLSCMILIFFFAALFAGISFQENKAKEKVKNDLKSKGCQDIEVTRIWEFGRRELTYEAKYRNPQGQLVANSCVVTFGFFSPSDVYWKIPI